MKNLCCQQAIQYMEYLVSVFESEMDFGSDIPISSILYDGMSRTKYLKPSGRSRYTKMLADDMNKFFRNMGICSVASVYQIQKVLLENLYDFSVVCQIAFYLGMRVEELTSSALTKEQIQQERDSHYMRNAAPVDWELLDREMGLRGHQLENMPRCKAVFEKYTESYPESWARKIIWAYRKLEEEGKPFCWTDIREISGVKKKNLEVVVPYLMKYVDDDMASQIVELIYDNKEIICDYG